MDISVIVPVYNSVDYMRAALESVISQTFPKIEILALNDGSTDNSMTILEEVAAQDARIRIISSEKNYGYGRTMNLGLAEACGKYVAILETNGKYHDGALKKLYELAERTGAQIAKGDYYVDSGGSSVATGKYSGLEEGGVYYPECVPEYLAGSVSIWSAIYRLDCLRDNGVAFSETGGLAHQDLGFGIRTWAAAHQIAITKEAVYHCREDNTPDDTTKRQEGAWISLNEFKLQKEVFQDMAKSSPALRSVLVKRIFLTLRADYLRRCVQEDETLLQEYSQLLQTYFPWGSFDLHTFSKAERHDLHLIYTAPLLFPKKIQSSTNFVQKIFSIRLETGKKVLRVFGMRFTL